MLILNCTHSKKNIFRLEQIWSYWLNNCMVKLKFSQINKFGFSGMYFLYCVTVRPLECVRDTSGLLACCSAG